MQKFTIASLCTHLGLVDVKLCHLGLKFIFIASLNDKDASYFSSIENFPLNFG